jgi:hypothetical protein
MLQPNSLSGRRFLEAAAAASCLTATRFAFSRQTTLKVRNLSPSHRNGPQANSRRHAKYISHTPLTITTFPAKRGAGGLHDFYSQADYLWPNPRIRMEPASIVMDRAIRRISMSIAR